jgi:HAE1 family hydrophobic/amphiphilic exporter-1
VGRLLHEFAVTIVIAILVSGVVSLTLTPMLCSRLIKSAKEEHAKRHGVFYRWSENGFEALRAFYERALRWSLGHRRSVFGVFLVSVALTVVLFRAMPQDFLPSEDVGQINAYTEGLNGISFEDMRRHQEQVSQILTQDPNITGFMSSVGAGGARGGSNSGTFRIQLKDRSERALSADQVIAELRRKLQLIPGINVFLQNRPPITIGGMISKAQYQYTLQDIDLKELYASSTKLEQALAKAPGFVDVTSDLDLSTPAVNVSINRDRAAALGITPEQIEVALGSAFGGQQVSTIYTSVDQYRVILELLPQYQRDTDALRRLYLGGNGSPLVPLSNVVQIDRGTQPLAENHFGQLPAVTLSFSLAPGVALSDAVSTIQRVQAETGMGASVQTSFQGTAKAFQESMNGMSFLLIGGILVVYIVLGILYESFIHPLTILSGLPSAAVGALLTLYLFHIPLTLYAFVGMIMLVGLVKKNAIMMVDFALTRERRDGIEPQAAIVEAALIRFRPIMMTTMASLMGSLPIAVGFGAGGESRQPLGLAVVGGLLLSQMLTLFITPVLYVYLDRFGHAIGGAKRPAHAPAE